MSTESNQYKFSIRLEDTLIELFLSGYPTQVDTTASNVTGLTETNGKDTSGVSANGLPIISILNWT